LHENKNICITLLIEYIITSKKIYILGLKARNPTGVKPRVNGKHKDNDKRNNVIFSGKELNNKLADKIKIVIYDFHKTLSDSKYFHGLDSSINENIDVFFKLDDSGLCDKWWTGEINTDEFLIKMSNEIRYDRIKLKSSLLSAGKHIIFNKCIFNSVNILKEKNIKTAIATINCDFFTNCIVPDFNLKNHFDYIANSSDYNTLNKLDMIEDILDTAEISSGNALLIDDNMKNLNDFNMIGGNSYYYANDSIFDVWFNNNFLLSE
jgi:hypothetical protein